MTYTISDFHSRSGVAGERGALLDLYAEAAIRLCEFVGGLSEADWALELPANDEDGGSVSSLLGHVIYAARHYVDIARYNYEGRGHPDDPADDDPRFVDKPDSVESLADQLKGVIGDMADFIWSLDDEQYDAFRKTPISTGKGSSIYLAMLLQHAICHIDRHRRQIERLVKETRKA